jgi:hypothetical protein
MHLHSTTQTAMPLLNPSGDWCSKRLLAEAPVNDIVSCGWHQPMVSKHSESLNAAEPFVRWAQGYTGCSEQQTYRTWLNFEQFWGERLMS